ncbi:MAG: DUF177 domain-containing protein [Acidobacteriota bacterium]
MELNISQIDERDGLNLTHRYTEGEIGLVGNDGKLVGRTAVNLQATREGEEVLLRGSVQANVQFECDRCLVEMTVPVTQSFDLLYLPASHRNAREEHELKADDLSIAYYQGHLINLDDLVREQIELTLPMTRICRENCQGLCTECGANLNEGKCNCGNQQIDPRWAALKGLKTN